MGKMCELWRILGSVLVILVLLDVVSFGEAYQVHALQNGDALLVESESMDPVLAIPDSAVWDATGSGSGNEDDDEAKTASIVELKIDNGNSPQIEAIADKPRIETGRSVEVVEVKDDGEKPQIEAKEDQTKEKSRELRSEANVTTQSEAKLPLENYTLPNKNVDNLPNDEPKTLADLLKDDEDMDKPLPKFETISDELKWKFNKARNDLKKAKQIVQLAEHIARKKHKGTTEEQAVKDIITKTEVAVVHAGEKMGLDYMHYRRRRSIDDDEEEFD